MLTFEPREHRYFLDGKEFPSVTTILKPYSGLEHVDRDLLERAAEFGTHVHEACHLFNMGALEWASLDEPLVPYVRAWESFLEDTGAVVLLSEHRVVSERNGFAGTLDTVVFWGKSNRLIDIKSAASTPKTVGMQLAAYAEAHAEMTGERIRDRHCVRLASDGRYASTKHADPSDWSRFKAALILHKWMSK
jgi:hypothetical protein